MDEHCIATMAVQLSGNRTWRLGDIPAQQWGRSTESMYFDGHVYREHPRFGFITHDRKMWRPTFSFEIKAGQAMFMPPGMIHETKNTGNGCATSITFQFPIPSPAVYWRSFLPRVSRTGDLASCQGNIAILAGAGERPAVFGSVAPAWQAGEKRFRQLDKDKDGALTEQEIAAGLTAGRHGRRFMHFTSVESLATDILMYHDINEDDRVSQAELCRNYAAWSLNMDSLKSERPVFWDEYGEREERSDEEEDEDDL